MHKEANPLLAYLSSVSPTSRQGYLRGAVPAFVEALTNYQSRDHLSIDWNQLTVDDVLTALARLQDAKKSERYINQVISLVRGVAKNAWLLGNMDGDIYARIKAIPFKKIQRLPAGREITHDELSAMNNAQQMLPNATVQARDKLVFNLLYSLGLRRFEVASLTLASVQMQRQIIRFIGKGNKEAELPYGADVEQALTDWLKLRGSKAGPLVCRIRKGGQIDATKALSDVAIRDILKRTAFLAGIDPSSLAPHDMRRSRITHLLDDGNKLRDVQALARHANANTTAKYDRSDMEENLRRLVNH
ncbi:MAG: tyrosine-type recombinase/integrase [Proteobacteria bacterium]|nr:tyrosine-type recombinase/integrase [Pseudomonadota bacterium]